MDIYKRILINILSKEKLNISFPEFNQDPSEAVEMACYQALIKIEAVIQNDSLSDADCFMKIEGIIDIIEDIGINNIKRHDFG